MFFFLASFFNEFYGCFAVPACRHVVAKEFDAGHVVQHEAAVIVYSSSLSISVTTLFLLVLSTAVAGSTRRKL